MNSHWNNGAWMAFGMGVSEGVSAWLGTPPAYSSGVFFFAVGSALYLTHAVKYGVD
jgi:hypothetical protein